MVKKDYGRSEKVFNELSQGVWVDGSSARAIKVQFGAEVLSIALPEPNTVASRAPSAQEIAEGFAKLPMQALREVERVLRERESFIDRGPDKGVHRVSADFDQSTGIMTLFESSREWDLARLFGHELAGHGIEAGDPLFYRLLMEAAYLDGLGAVREYGERAPGEFFATFIEEWVAGDNQNITISRAGNHGR